VPAWFGRPESVQLEYKSGRALDDPEQIVRAVVALLNGEGGDVVVGVDDRGRPEGVADAPQQADRLQHLVSDRIDPRPEPGHVYARVASVSGADVIELRVKPSPGRLSAERRKGLLGFWVREGATTRGLDAEEVCRVARSDVQDLGPGWPSLVERWSSRPLLLGAVVSLDPTELGRDTLLQLARTLPHAYEELGLRPTGWIVLPPPDWPLPPAKPARGELRLGSPDDYRGLVVQRSGRVVGVAHGAALCHYAQGTRPAPVLRPDALVETFVSIVRVAGFIAGCADLGGRARLELKLVGAQDWFLRPHVPGSIGWSMPAELRSEARLDEDPEPSTVYCTWDELERRPDSCAHEALARLWDWFGWDETQLPGWRPDARRFEWASA